MRILFVNQRVDYASATSYSLDLATGLLEKGDDVQLCTLGGDFIRDFEAVGIETYRVRFNPFAYRRLLGFLREYDPELVHVQSLRSLPTGRRLATHLRRPFIVTVHRSPLPDAPLLRSRYLGGVIAVNEVIREKLVNLQNLPKQSVRVIPRGIRFPRPRSWGSGEERPADHIPVVGSVGRLERHKGNHLLIAAARKVLDMGVEAHFAIVGEGEEERRLRALVKELGLEEHVTFSPPLSSRSEIYGLFDLVALPVLSSGVGVSALEAMAMGKPLLASGVGEMLHLVQDGRTGLLVPEGNVEVLADRIAGLIRNPAWMESLGRQARQWVETHFALEPMVNETRAYYRDVLVGERAGV
jgi:glycosyltransferase involved in cell wall biosynthesis